MISRGQLKDDILTISHRTNDTTVSARVDRLINQELLEICKRISIRELRDNVTVNMASTDYSNGMFIPGDLLGIDRVWDETNNVEFIERDRPDIDPQEMGFRFYRHNPYSEPFKRWTNLELTTGTKQFTSASLDTWVAAGNTVTGEYVRFGEGFGVYLLTSSTSPYTFTPTYYAGTLTSGTLQLRPRDTQRIVIIDSSENELKDRSIEIYYWKMPVPLYTDDQIIPLPSIKALKLRVLRELPQAKPFRPVSENEVDKAMADLKKMNPSDVRKPKPRDRHNRMFKMSSNIFKRRPDSNAVTTRSTVAGSIITAESPFQLSPYG